MNFILFLIAFAASLKCLHWGFMKVWPQARPLVVTDLWGGRSATAEDYRTWLDMAITAAAGGVLGFLVAVALEQLYMQMRKSQLAWPSWTSIIAMLVLTFLGAKLFAPIHDLIERLLHSRLLGRRPQEDTPAVSGWHNAATVGAILFAFLLIDETAKELIDGALKGLSQELGLFESIKTLAYAGVFPGVIAYYWAAALRKRPGDDALQVFLGTTCAVCLLMAGGMLAAFTASFFYIAWTTGVNGPVDAFLNFLAFTGGIVLTALLAAIFGGLFVGLPAAVGILATQSVKKYRAWALLGTIMGFAVLLNALPGVMFLVVFSQALATTEIPGVGWRGLEIEIVSALAQALAPPLFWVAALLLEPRFRALLNDSDKA